MTVELMKVLIKYEFRTSDLEKDTESDTDGEVGKEEISEVGLSVRNEERILYVFVISL